MKISSAREEILQRIRLAKSDVNDLVSMQAAWAVLPRTYRRTGMLSPEELLDLLAHRLQDYGASVTRTIYSDLPQAIAGRIAACGRESIAIPTSFPRHLLPAGFQFVSDDHLSAEELDCMDGVITESTIAIAETETIVLHSLSGQGRRALSLVPDYHLCLVHTRDVVETVPEAIARMTSLTNIPAMLISGPSATADIEMTRIQGVHGPRQLDVLLIST